jgi:hypothetical protein
LPEQDLPARIARTLADAYRCPQLVADAERAVRTLAAAGAATGLGRADVDRRMRYWHQRMPGALWSLATLEDALDDLAAALREPPSWRIGRVVAALAEHWNIVLAFFGLLASAAVYAVSLGYQRFYDALGLDPADVGIGPAEVLGRSALGTALFTVVAAVVLVALLAPVAAVIAPMAERQEKRLPGGCSKAVVSPRLSREQGVLFAALLVVSFTLLVWIVGVKLGCVGACSASLALAVALPPGWPTIAASATSGLIVVLLTSPTWLGGLVIVSCFVLAAHVMDAVRGLQARRTTLPRVTVDAVRVDVITNVSLTAGATMICVTAVIGTLPSIGSDAGERARFGRSIDASKFAGVPLLDIHARPAKVIWKSPADASHRADVRGCLLYVGRDAGTALVYQVRRKQPVTAANRNDPPAIASRALLRIEPGDAFVTIARNDQCLPESDTD